MPACISTFGCSMPLLTMLSAAVPIHARGAQRMSEALALHYAAEALRCVGALHGCALLHCDLKPDNFLLAPRGRLQLIDFGRAVDLALLPDATLFLVRDGVAE